MNLQDIWRDVLIRLGLIGLHHPQVIRRFIRVANIPDNTPTTIFYIDTTDEPGNYDGGGYVCRIRGQVGHAVSSGSGAAAEKFFAAHFGRVMAGTGSGVLSAVAEEHDDALAATNPSVRSIGDIVLSVGEVNEYRTAVQIAIDLTGSSVSTAVVALEIELIWDGFLTPPRIVAA